MKILIIGDFHGKFPKKLENKIKKESFDFIFSPGDFCGSEEWKRFFFNYVYGTDLELEDFIGKKKLNELEKNIFNSGKKILEKLNQMKKPVIAVSGNWDPTQYSDIGFPNKKEKFTEKFYNVIKKLKNIKLIDFKSKKISGINIVGYPRSTYPGKPEKKISEKNLERFEGDKKQAEKFLRKVNKDNQKYFNKFNKIVDKNTILISHNCPYNTPLDKIKKGIQKGENYGSYLTKKIIINKKPFLVICGHIHENQGKQKIGNSLIINPGAVKDGKAAIIEINDKKKKVKKVKFIK